MKIIQQLLVFVTVLNSVATFNETYVFKIFSVEEQDKKSHKYS